MTAKLDFQSKLHKFKSNHALCTVANTPPLPTPVHFILRRNKQTLHIQPGVSATGHRLSGADSEIFWAVAQAGPNICI